MQTTVPSRRLLSAAAQVAVKAAVDKAYETGASVNAAAVDAGGNLLAFLRGDGAFTASEAIAQDKARTAAGFAMSTRKLYAVVAEAPDVATGIAGRPGVAAFPGGLPIFDGGDLVGAIGVSGATADQDEICAMAGITAIGLSFE